MGQRIQVTYDCRDVHMRCEWWAERLGYVVEDAHEAVQRLLDESVLTPDTLVQDYVDAGASFTAYGEHPGNRWAVMADPEGNEFCIQ